MLFLASPQDLQRLRRYGHLLWRHRPRLPEPRPPSGQRERIPLPGRVSPTDARFNISHRGHDMSVCILYYQHWDTVQIHLSRTVPSHSSITSVINYTHLESDLHLQREKLYFEATDFRHHIITGLMWKNLWLQRELCEIWCHLRQHQLRLKATSF